MPQRNTKHLQEDSPKLVSPTVLNEETLSCQQCSKLSSSSVTVLPETVLVEQDLGQKALSLPLTLMPPGYEPCSFWHWVWDLADSVISLHIRPATRLQSTNPGGSSAQVAPSLATPHDSYPQPHLSTRWRWSCQSTAHKHLSPTTSAAASTISGTPTGQNNSHNNNSNKNNNKKQQEEKSNTILQNQDIQQSVTPGNVH